MDIFSSSAICFAVLCSVKYFFMMVTPVDSLAGQSIEAVLGLNCNGVLWLGGSWSNCDSRGGSYSTWRTIQAIGGQMALQVL